MRKYMLLFLVMALVMSLAGVSAAAESVTEPIDEVLMAEAEELAAVTGVVGEDIEIGEGEMKIVSLPDDQGDGGGTDAVAPIAPDELLMEEQKRVDAANEGSVSTDNDSGVVMTPVEDIDMPVSNSDSVDELTDEELADLAAQSGVVGEDIEIGDGEMKIVSAPDVVGEDIEIDDDMAKIVSVEEAAFNWPLAAGIAGGVIVLGGVIFLLIKKSHKPVTAA